MLSEIRGICGEPEPDTVVNRVTELGVAELWYSARAPTVLLSSAGPLQGHGRGQNGSLGKDRQALEFRLAARAKRARATVESFSSIAVKAGRQRT